MSLILTFLGKGGVGRTTVAIAAAKRLANSKRVLLAFGDTGPVPLSLVGANLSADPQQLAPNLDAVQFQSTVLLERSWEEVKKLEAQYLRTPIIKEVYGQELGVLPGMDSALALNALREYDAAGKYDVLVYDGTGDKALLRMLGTPEIASWYIRRFRDLFINSDLGKTLSPFIQPVTAAILNVNIGDNNFAQPTNQVNNLLDQGKAAMSDPKRVVAYLVTGADNGAQAQAKYLWGSAQQVGLTVAGVIFNSASVGNTSAPEEFAPLPVSTLPVRIGDDWQPLIDALPDFLTSSAAPKPIEIDIAARQVRLFLPGFDKKQVKLTQSGPEVTIDAGDQRRNIYLPPQLSGQSVKGAKFQNNYLTISF